MNRLKDLRLKYNLLQKDIESRLGLGRGNLSNYENEKRALTAELICKFADLFGCSTDYLLGRTAKEQVETDLPEADWLILDAYHRATLRDRQLVDSILREYRTDDKKIDAL